MTEVIQVRSNKLRSEIHSFLRSLSVVRAMGRSCCLRLILCIQYMYKRNVLLYSCTFVCSVYISTTLQNFRTTLHYGKGLLREGLDTWKPQIFFTLNFRQNVFTPFKRVFIYCSETILASLLRFIVFDRTRKKRNLFALHIFSTFRDV
jgi:hypothetical protein